MDSRDNNWTSVVGQFFPVSEVACPSCGTTCTPRSFQQEVEFGIESGHCIAVTMKGRFDVSHGEYMCPDCKCVHSSSDPLVLVQLGFWPGSVTNVRYAFHQDLFQHWDILQKQVPGISQTSFIKSLECYSSKKGRVGVINDKAFSASFREWKYLQFEVDGMREVNWMECPCCTEHQHSVHVDGNMKLRRRSCYYGEAFIASNEKVDSHLESIYQGQRRTQRSEDQDIKCGDSTWRAAANSPKKKKNLDESGLEISGCRHGLAQHAVNMMRGEIYGYAHYMQVNHYINPTVDFFWYDVVCKYWPWLGKCDKKTQQLMKPALSVMHAKAHAWYCQDVWGGRWQNGAAATTGEEVEAINSHFSRLGTSTKHMLPEGREELITEHALRWNRNKIQKLASFLSKRYTKVKTKTLLLKSQLEENAKAVGLTEENMNAQLSIWKGDLLAAALLKQESLNTRANMSSEEKEFLQHLLSLEAFTPKQKILFDVAEKIYGKKITQLEAKDLVEFSNGENTLTEKALDYFKLDMEHHHASIAQLTFNMGKLADSSKQRKRIRKKISKEKTGLENSLLNYNKVAPQPLSNLNDILNGKFPWTDESKTSDEVTISTKRGIVDKYMELERFNEEICLIQEEMIRFLTFYIRRKFPELQRKRDSLKYILEEEEDTELNHTSIKNATSNSSAENGCYETNSEEEGILRGKLAMVNEGIQFVLEQIVAGISHFSAHLNNNSMDDFQELLQNYVDDANEIHPDAYDHHNDGNVSNDDYDSSDADEEEDDTDHP
ncbi:Hypothetical predicted protein [Paramuricea clavata]|uniref:Uncharacterized protein n=1 Tax=Paramuricea clavata TaxID=317549 RepID=A0A6S7H2B1_PARCT|nr:Hypothetical predicted protein [Paramuricea clavata]